MKKRNYLIIALCIVSLLFPGAVFARQEGQLLSLSLIRNFGFGGLGKIQGSFTLRIVSPPDDLEEVSFYIDGELMEVVTQSPFQIKFHTSDFADGDHQMSAIGILKDGSARESNTVTKTFLSSNQAWSETQGVLVPLLVGVGVVTLIGIGAPLLLGQKKKFSLGSYGPAGGAVCPRCALPFSRSYLAPNMLVGKLVRCPHCGKFSILPGASSAILQEAEKRYSEEGNGPVVSKSQEDIKKMIEESRFED